MEPETERVEVGGEAIIVRRMERDVEAEACARIMAASEPWITLGRSYDASLEILRDASREVYIAACLDTEEVIGFVIVNMRGAFVGYVQTVAVHEDRRGRGLGRRLIAFAGRR